MSLISAFIVHCLDSVLSLVAVNKIRSLMLASVAEQASLSLTWSATPEDTFSHDEAQLLYVGSLETQQLCLPKILRYLIYFVDAIMSWLLQTKGSF